MYEFIISINDCLSFYGDNANHEVTNIKLTQYDIDKG